MKRIIFAILSIGLFSCEDVIDLTVKEGKSQLVVDAWITDESRLQTVKLSISQPYFDQDTPIAATGAEVFLIREDSTIFRFIDEQQNGNYVFRPRDRRFLSLNQRVGLYIKYNGEEYYSISQLKRVPSIDSLKYQSVTLPIKPEDSPQSGFLAQFYANDFVGEGDTYLIRSYKNDVLRTKSNEFTLAYDAAFAPGTKTDGILFIQPLRMAINSGLYSDGDKVTVELFSIPVEAFYFLNQVQAETNNGGIFSTPPSNVPTNIINMNPDSKEKAVGAFIVSRVTRYSAFIDKNNASEEN